MANLKGQQPATNSRPGNTTLHCYKLLPKHYPSLLHITTYNITSYCFYITSISLPFYLLLLQNRTFHYYIFLHNILLCITSKLLPYYFLITSYYYKLSITTCYYLIYYFVLLDCSRRALPLWLFQEDTPLHREGGRVRCEPGPAAPAPNGAAALPMGQQLCTRLPTHLPPQSSPLLCGRRLVFCCPTWPLARSPIDAIRRPLHSPMTAMTRTPSRARLRVTFNIYVYIYI
jgi:hypothetical protein